MSSQWLGAIISGTHPSRRQQTIELAVFLLLIVPSMLLSFGPVDPQQLSFRSVAVASIVRDLALLALVLYFLFANRESLQAIGWRRIGLKREVGVGVVLFLPLYLTVGFLGGLLQEAGLSGMDEPPAFLLPAGAAEYALAVVFLVVVAVAEETIFRGYLLLRLGSLTRSPVLAVVLSALIFSMGHGYQGGAGVIAVGVLGLLYAVVYLWRGSLVAPITMHLLQNSAGLLLAPLAQRFWS